MSEQVSYPLASVLRKAVRRVRARPLVSLVLFISVAAAFVFWSQLSSLAWQGQLVLLVLTVAISFAAGYYFSALRLSVELERRLPAAFHKHDRDSGVRSTLDALLDAYLQLVRETQATRYAFDELRNRLNALESCIGGVSFQTGLLNAETIEVRSVGDNITRFFNVSKADFQANWNVILQQIKLEDRQRVSQLMQRTEAFPVRESVVFARHRAAHEKDRYFQLTVVREIKSGHLLVSGVIADVTELEQAKQLAETEDKAKSQFLATVSHELRTPLNAIIGFSKILEQQLQNDSELQADANNIVVAGESLKVILSDIMDYSRIQAEGMKLDNQSFNLRDMLSGLLQINQQLAVEKGISLRFEDRAPDMPQLIGDPNRLRQVMQNLLSNAIKFTAEGCVTLRLGATEPVNQRVEVFMEVQDTGLGISQVEIRRLFRPFTQASRETHRKYGGTGLGLAISKGLVELMGGQIDVTSEPGVGAVFSVRLSLSVSQRDLETAKPVIAESRKLKILAVDDHPMNLKLLNRFLGRKGHEVENAQSGQEAVSMASENCYDLILMDIDMPGMDGHEASVQIRSQQGQSAASPIYALSGLVDKESIQKTADSGMQGHLTKPLSFDELNEVLAKVAEMMPQGQRQVSEAISPD